MLWISFEYIPKVSWVGGLGGEARWQVLKSLRVPLSEETKPVLERTSYKKGHDLWPLWLFQDKCSRTLACTPAVMSSSSLGEAKLMGLLDVGLLAFETVS